MFIFCIADSRFHLGFDNNTFLHDIVNYANNDLHAQLEAHAQNDKENIA